MADVRARPADVPGFSIGHWTDTEAATGCTVLLFDRPAHAACDVRGAAPGSRELELLAPGRTVQRADAILLTGGSAYGLAAADGVMQWLREQERGFPTAAGAIPIVPATVIFDLAVGNPVAPDAAAGYHAADATMDLSRATSGRVGAGTGATYGHIRGDDLVRPGGCAIAQVSLGEGTITAVVVLNAYGDALTSTDGDPRPAFLDRQLAPPVGESTTLMVCVTDLPLHHDALINVTVAMQDGLSRTIAPAHTLADGDIAFAVSLTEGPTPSTAQVMRATVGSELAIEAAIGNLLSLP